MINTEMLHKIYDEIRIIDEDNILVRKNYKWGLLDRNLKILLPFLYDYIEINNDKITINLNGKLFTIKRNRLPIVYTFFSRIEGSEFIKTFCCNKYGIINNSFKEIVPCKFDNIEFTCNRIWAERKVGEEESLMTIYSYDGTICSENKYTSFPTPIVSKIVDGSTKYGIINENSEEEIMCIYDSINYIFDYDSIRLNTSLKDHFILHKDNKKYIYHRGKGIEPRSYDDILSINSEKSNNSELQSYRYFSGPYYLGIRNNIIANDKETSPMSTIIDFYIIDKLALSFSLHKTKLHKFINNNCYIFQSLENNLFAIATSKGFITPFIYRYLFLHDKQYTSGQGIVALNVLVAEREVNNEGNNSSVTDLYSIEGKLLVQGIPTSEIQWKQNKKVNDTIFMYLGEIIIFNNKTGFINRLPKESKIDFNNQKNECMFCQSGKLVGLINEEGEFTIPQIYEESKISYISDHIIKGETNNKIDYYIVNKGACINIDYDYVEEDSYLLKVAKFNKGVSKVDNNYHCWGIINLCGEIIVECEYLNNALTILSSDCIRILENTYRYIDSKGWPIWGDDIEKYYNGEYYIYKLNFERLNVLDRNLKKYFLANNNRKRLTKDYYESISDFNNKGIARISNGPGEEGLINVDGEIIIPCKYNIAYDWVRISNNSVLNKKNPYIKINNKEVEAYIDISGRFVIPPIYSTIELLAEKNIAIVSNHNKYGLISLNSPYNPIILCEWEHIIVSNINNQDFVIARKSNKTLVYDLKRQEIVAIIPFEADSIFIYRENTLGLHIKRHNENPEKYIFWNLKDSCYICSYDEIGIILNDHIQVNNKGRWGLYNCNLNKEDIPCLFYEGWMASKMKASMLFSYKGYSKIFYKGHYYLIDTDLKLVTNAYDWISEFFNSYAIFEKGKMYGLLNIDGTEISYGYDDVPYYNFYNPSKIITFKRDDLWGFVDTKGKEISYGYEDVSRFNEGYAAVKLNGKWGFIDEKGKIIIPCRFADVSTFSEGLAAVAFKKRWGYIDKFNHTIIPFKYDNASDFDKGFAETNISDRDGEYYLTISKQDKVIKEKFIDKDPEPDYKSARRDSWNAMTDSMYGDMPDDFDDDYSFLGY